MTHALSPAALPHQSRLAAPLRIAPGLGLCLVIAVAALGLQSLEIRLFGRSWLEALVIAILLGAALRTAGSPSPIWQDGIVVLLGATISGAMIVSAGLGLLIGIMAVVFLAIGASYSLGRLLGLPHRMATLIACGNAICGNSAIAAVAPVIGAEGEDVAAAIAFTAVLGVAVVLGLPVLAVAWSMTPRSFGVFAGLTVYAVPQVLAATAPISSVSAQIGTLVKLIRVLMLGPVVLVLSLIDHEDRDKTAPPAPAVTAGDRPITARPALHHLVPWFILGFLVLVALRSAGLVPADWLHPISTTASGLTVVSMAALGLGVDVRVIAKAGLKATATVTLSLLALGGMALLVICGLGIA